jgi:predicted phosphoribosyltransferase
VAAEIARRVGGELGLTVSGVNGRVVVVVPDGLPSASATLDALRSVRQQEPELLVLATPVCPDVAMDLIAAVVDETICVYRAEDVPSGRWYARDTRISDDDIRSLLRRPPPRPGTYHARVLRWARQAASS